MLWVQSGWSEQEEWTGTSTSQARYLKSQYQLLGIKSAQLSTDIDAAMRNLPDPPAPTSMLHPASILRLSQIKSDKRRS
jgi:hypothetical protein